MFLSYGLFFAAAFYAASFGLLIAVAVYDLRHRMVPNAFVYPFIALSLVPLFVSFPGPSFFGIDGLRALAGPLIAAPLFLLWAFSRGRWIGFGDVKLALGMGWLLGLAGGVTALMLAFWSGAAVGLGVLVASRGSVLRFLGGFYPLTLKK